MTTATFDPATRTLIIRDPDGRLHTWADIDLNLVVDIPELIAEHIRPATIGPTLFDLPPDPFMFIGTPS